MKGSGNVFPWVQKTLWNRIFFSDWALRNNNICCGIKRNQTNPFIARPELHSFSRFILSFIHPFILFILSFIRPFILGRAIQPYTVGPNAMWIFWNFVCLVYESVICVHVRLEKRRPPPVDKIGVARWRCLYRKRGWTLGGTVVKLNLRMMKEIMKNIFFVF